MSSSSMAADHTHCYGCGLCTLACPLWQQSGDLRATPQGHFRALQQEGEVDHEALFACLLCGTCEALCPEGIKIIDQLLALRSQANGVSHTVTALQPEPVRGGEGQRVLFDAALRELGGESGLLEKIVSLLSVEGEVESAEDPGDAIATALRSGQAIAPATLDAFLEPLRDAHCLIVSDGLLACALQGWLPGVEVRALGHALSQLEPVIHGLDAGDLYLIESCGYNRNFASRVEHYDALRRRVGCRLSVDLQRLAIPLSGGEREAGQHFDPVRQAQWILQGHGIGRVVVENAADIALMREVTGLPVVHLAEVAA